MEEIGDSYSAGFRDDDVFRNNQLLFFEGQCNYTRDKNLKEAEIVAKKIYYLFLFKAALRQKDLRIFTKGIKLEKNKGRYIAHIIYRILKKLGTKES